ncbi:MAG: methyltransferase [Candidatus Nanoarchaeia archaeon]
MFKLKTKTLEVYTPAEDSFLLQSCIPLDLKRKDVLDMGTGSGILAITAAKRGANVLAVDLNPRALKIASENAKNNNVKISFLKSNIFSNVKGKFDLILCNPPYLPEDEIDKIIGPSLTYSGGKDGKEFIKKFVSDAPKFLKKYGKILMVISSITGEKEVLELFAKNNFKTKILARQKIPWEELIVIEARFLT